MAAVTGSTTQHFHHNVDGVDAPPPTTWSPVILTALVIVALAFAFGPLWVGLVVAGMFLFGNLLVAWEGRTLALDEFAAISTLHAAATVVVAMSF